MKQISLATTGFELVTKRTRKRVFLDEMNLVVPWTELVGLIQPFAPSGAGAKGGRPAFAVETMLRIHFLQQWFGLSDPAMEESLHDTPLYCEFARLDPGATRLPDESTILRFRHLLEANNLSLQIMAAINATLTKRGLLLKTGTVVDATLIAAPSSTKNSTGERDPEMHQTKKGNQWHFGSATCKSHVFLFHKRRSYELMKPVVPPTVPYLDMRCWQRRGVKLQGQRTLRLNRYVKPRGETNSASTTVERG